MRCTTPRETGPFERYLDSALALVVNIFLVALDDVDYPEYDGIYMAAIDDRHFRLLLDFFGNLDAPL